MGTTIGNVMMSYDITSKNTEVKTALQAIKYFDYWTKDGVRFELPESTLWKKNITSNKAMEELKEICDDLEVEIDKVIVVRATEFVGVN